MPNTVQFDRRSGRPEGILVCVDAFSQGEIYGRLEHSGLPEPFEFAGVATLARGMEQLFQNTGYPQPAFETRSFQHTPRPKERGATEGGETMTTENTRENAMERQEPERGKRATFVVRVQFRQNSTWQGTVDWTDKKKSQSFRSMLELIRLMDNALTEEQVEDAFLEWE